MNENHLFSYIRKWCMVCGLCLIFPLIAYPQQQKISVTIRNLSLKQAMEQISKQAEMNVAYSKEFVDTNKKVSLKVQNVELEDALSSLLKGMNIGFRFLDNSILLYNKNEQKKEDTSSDKKKEVSVNGQVVDKMTGEPIVGATISVVGTSTGTITDIDGNYSLKVDEGSTLLFSFIGYTEVKQVVRQPGKLDVTLVESAIQLNDVVVVGYGVQKKVNLTGAVSMVKGDVLENRPISNVSTGLQGLLPGVTITSSSGQPGAVPDIKIRGVNTINSSTSPLILIDGVAGGDMNLLNPGDLFDNLPETYIIFITKNNILEYSQPISHIQRRIKETEDTFQDGQHILYVNSKKQDDTELDRLMHDLHCKEADKMYSNVLSARVQQLKETTEGVNQMCQELEEIYNEGEQSGELKKARETALTLLDMGMPAEQIAKAVNLSIETVQNWIAETNS